MDEIISRRDKQEQENVGDNVGGLFADSATMSSREMRDIFACEPIMDGRLPFG